MYCIFVSWDFRINTDYYPKRIKRKILIKETGCVLRETETIFIYVGIIFIDVSLQMFKILTRC
jgi:hypothetical protein